MCLTVAHFPNSILTISVVPVQGAAAFQVSLVCDSHLLTISVALAVLFASGSLFSRQDNPKNWL